MPTESRFDVGVSPADIAISDNSITVTSSATELAASGTPLADRRTLCIFNNSSVTIYIGDSGVTTSTGFPLGAGAAMYLDVSDDVDVYAIAASGSNNVRILELA